MEFSIFGTTNITGHISDTDRYRSILGSRVCSETVRGTVPSSKLDSLVGNQPSEGGWMRHPTVPHLCNGGIAEYDLNRTETQKIGETSKLLERCLKQKPTHPPVGKSSWCFQSNTKTIQNLPSGNST